MNKAHDYWSDSRQRSRTILTMAVALLMVFSSAALAYGNLRDEDVQQADNCAMRSQTWTDSDSTGNYGWARNDSEPSCYSAMARINWERDFNLYTDTDYSNSGNGIYEMLANMSFYGDAYYDRLNYSSFESVSGYLRITMDHSYSCYCTNS